MNIEKINTMKTPISVLTEMMVKKCSIPSWELVHDGGGTHENLFIYKVTCDGLSAEGEGRNKRDAKHQAATKMLELLGQQSSLLQLPATPNPSPVRTPLPVEPPTCPMSPANVPFRNTVGDLKDLCGMNSLEEPKYREVADVGPPHNRVFTIQCSVSTFTEEGVAKTKKQAKHEAARKMLDRIQANLESIKKDHQVIINANNEDVEMVDAKAVELYPQLSYLQNCELKLKVNLGIKIKNYHKNLKEYFIIEESLIDFLDSIENILSLTKICREKFNEDNYREVKDQFQDLLELLDVKNYETPLECKDENFYICCLRVNTAPDIVEIALGKTEEEAYLKALQSTLETMKLLLL